jgi:tetratricopeptide (TPR) repeat protein
MRAVHAAHPQDADVAALFAEAMITRTPWKLWNTRTGEPLPGSDTLEALRVVEDALAFAPDHPGLLHLHIHLLEMSLTSERALPSADRLRGIARDAGHLRHMPAHIYVLTGQWDRAVEVSRRAIAVNRKYLAYAGSENFYTTARCHDLHMMMYAAMMSGKYTPALAAAEEMQATLTPDLLAVKKPHMAVTMEGYYSTKLHVLVRFGRWRDIIREPLPEDRRLYCVTIAMHRYARTLAHAALGQIAEAEAERAAFYKAWEAIPPTRLFFNNLAADILAVGAAMLEGELAYRKGDHDLAFDHLREAARRDDNLYYTEPWAWMHPPRHALGALLLEQGRVEEAEAVYRADLGYDDTLCRCSRHTENVWALHGFTECAERLGKTAEAAFARQRLTLATARADFPIEASCCCRGR